MPVHPFIYLLEKGVDALELVALGRDAAVDVETIVNSFVGADANCDVSVTLVVALSEKRGRKVQVNLVGRKVVAYILGGATICVGFWPGQLDSIKCVTQLNKVSTSQVAMHPFR